MGFKRTTGRGRKRAQSLSAIGDEVENGGHALANLLHDLSSLPEKVLATLYFYIDLSLLHQASWHIHPMDVGGVRFFSFC